MKSPFSFYLNAIQSRHLCDLVALLVFILSKSKITSIFRMLLRRKFYRNNQINLFFILCLIYFTLTWYARQMKVNNLNLIIIWKWSIITGKLVDSPLNSTIFIGPPVIYTFKPVFWPKYVSYPRFSRFKSV